MLMGAMRRQHPDDLRLRRADGGRARPPSGKTVDLIDGLRGASAATRPARSATSSSRRSSRTACPTCGSCSGMFTANSMNCLCEALGHGAARQRHDPGHRSPERDDALPARGRRGDRRPGRRRTSARARSSRPRRSTTPSPSTWRWAAARTRCCTRWPSRIEAGVAVPARAAQRGRRRACRTSARSARPRRTYHIEDVHRAGGISAILQRARAASPARWTSTALTVTGQTLGENIADAPVQRRRRHPPARAALPAHGRPGGAVRQPGARRRGGQDRRGRPEPGQFRGPARDLREPGRGAQRRSSAGKVEGRRRRRDPLRGPARRPGHAGDARADRRTSWAWGSGDSVRADHRRPLQRRHARRLHRPRQPRGRRRRPDRGAARRRHRSRSTSRPAGSTSSCRDDGDRGRASPRPSRPTAQLTSRWLRRYRALVTSANTGAILREPAIKRAVNGCSGRPVSYHWPRMATILLVDDEPTLVATLDYNLRRDGLRGHHRPRRPGRARRRPSAPRPTWSCST